MWESELTHVYLHTFILDARNDTSYMYIVLQVCIHTVC